MAIVRPSAFRRASILLALGGALGCAGEGTEAPRMPATIIVSLSKLTLMVGETHTLTAEPRDDIGVVPGQTVLWSSSDPTIATVSDGIVVAKAVGTATITASAGGHQANVALTVTPLAVAGVLVTPGQKTLYITQTTQLAATPLSAAGIAVPDRAVTWTSTDQTVATVTQSGLVTARDIGVVGITAIADGKPGTAVITVAPVPVATLRFTTAPAEIFMGEENHFEAQTLDSAGGALPGRTIRWASSDATIASVFALSPTLGDVIGSRPGSVTITATSEGKSVVQAIAVLFAPRLRIGVSGIPAPFHDGAFNLKGGDVPFDADIAVPAGPAVNFNHISPGSYTLTARPIDATVNGVPFIYLPPEADAVRTFTVTTTATTNVVLAWTLRSGALEVTPTGIPGGGGIACAYDFAPPGLLGNTTGGFSVPTAQTTTVAVRGAGPVTLRCQPVTVGGVTYVPTVPVQSFSVPAAIAPLGVTIAYAPQ